jgi:hypothetical protein
MKEKIDKHLSQKAPLKARDIANELRIDRSEVNSFLHNHTEHYQQDEEYRWSPVKGHEFVLTLPGSWVNAGGRYWICNTNNGGSYKGGDPPDTALLAAAAH